MATWRSSKRLWCEEYPTEQGDDAKRDVSLVLSDCSREFATDTLQIVGVRNQAAEADAGGAFDLESGAAPI